MARDEELIQKAKEVREGLIAMAEDQIDATHIEVGAITAKDDARKLLTIMIGGTNRLVPYQGHDTSDFVIGEYWAVIFDDYGTIRLGWWVSDAVGGGTRPLGPHALDPDAGPHTGVLTEDDVTFDDATGHDHQGAGATGKKLTAGDVINVPAGGIAATDVQGAINELDTEKSEVATFLDLTDTPGSYVGEGGKNVRVNVGENALEFVAPGAPGAHAATHEDIGADEINVAGLSGQLADVQKVEIQEDDVKVLDATIINFEGGGGKVVDEGGGKGTVDITGGGGAGADISARVYHNANQSIANSTPGIVLAFNSERFDTDAIHDNAVNNSRLTCKTAGKYQITANIQWANNSTNARWLYINFNGATTIARTLNRAYADTSQSLTTLYAFEVNDYVEVGVYQDSGAPQNILATANHSPEFMMAKILG